MAESANTPGTAPVITEKVRTRFDDAFLPSSVPQPSVTPSQAKAEEDAQAKAVEKAVAEAEGKQTGGEPAKKETPERNPDGTFRPAGGAPKPSDAPAVVKPKAAEAKAKGESAPEPAPAAPAKAKEPEPAPPAPAKPSESSENEAKVQAGLAAVAREERRLHAQKQEFKREREALSGQLKSFETKAKQLDDILAAAKADPVKFLQAAGVELDQSFLEPVVRHAAGLPAPEKNRELEELRKLTLEAKAAAEKTPQLIAQAKAEAARSAMVQEIGHALSVHKDTWPAVLAWFDGDARKAASAIMDHHDDLTNAGQTPDIRKIAEEFETQCRREFDAMTEKAAAVKRAYAPPPSAAAEEPAKALAPEPARAASTTERKAPTTITNDVASTASNGSSRRKPGFRTDEDDLESAVALARKARGK